jgi:XTP/dITP diphosphohydrolase
MLTLLIATRNAHKVGEIRAILGSDFDYLSLEALPGAPPVIEDAATFAGNATKKSVALARWFASRTEVADQSTGRAAHLTGSKQVLVLADDSGLEVDALDGAPGVSSARFAALEPDPAHASRNSSDPDNNAKLLRQLEGVPLEQRTARFRCVLALTPVVWPAVESASPVCYAEEAELQTELFEGVCEGRVGLAPRGASGFGYDPLFFPEGFDQTYAELGEEVKNRLSHRARALAKLKEHLSRSAR